MVRFLRICGGIHRTKYGMGADSSDTGSCVCCEVAIEFGEFGVVVLRDVSVGKAEDGVALAAVGGWQLSVGRGSRDRAVACSDEVSVYFS